MNLLMQHRWLPSSPEVKSAVDLFLNQHVHVSFEVTWEPQVAIAKPLSVKAEVEEKRAKKVQFAV